MKQYLTVKNISLFLISIIFMSLVLSSVIDRDPQLYIGQPVVILVSTERIPGHIYNIRGDGRYTIRYINIRGEPLIGTFKRFEFEVVE